MTSFTFSAEQVRSAPPEVRRWIETEVVSALRGSLDHDASRARANTLQACSFEDVTEIFNMISNDLFTVQVFFELARETPFNHKIPQLHALDFADIVRHTQLGDGNRVIACLNIINHALQRVRNDPDLSLFGSDESGHVFVHEATSHNIRKLWEQLVATHPSQGTGRPAEPKGTPAFNVAPGFAAREIVNEMQPEHAFTGPPGA